MKYTMIAKAPYTKEEKAAINKAKKEKKAAKAPILFSELTGQIVYRDDLDQKLLKQRHFGQRKLLLAEIEFLTMYGNKSDIILYIGAAPGIHLPFLSFLFPRHKFMLYDSEAFSSQVVAHKQMKIFKSYFGSNDAKEYAGKSILFISGIRTVGIQKGDKFEKGVLDNMRQQEGWIKVMRPAATMIKFRLPFFAKEKIKTIAGKLYLQAWAKQRSTECRMMILPEDINKTVEYDPKEYEEILNYHNIVNRNVRKWEYPIELKEAPRGYATNSYDAAREVGIWHNYDPKGDVSKYIVMTNEQIKSGFK